jgi:cell wall-associated NlpC family hydrolase
VAQLRADRASATQAVADRQHALAQVKGQLATLVAEVQKAQQAAEQAQLRKSLAQHSGLPPASKAVDPPAPPPTHPLTTPATVAHSDPTPTTSPPTTAPPATRPATPPPPSGGNVPAPGWATAVHYAYAQLGKPYQWGGAGPNSFDCSGLTMMAWAAAGVSLPHLAQGQYDLSQKIPLADLLPGDLIFFGTPSNVYHVGIYIGGGQMIDAPETGQDVSISSIYWTNLLGAGRV